MYSRLMFSKLPGVANGFLFLFLFSATACSGQMLYSVTDLGDLPGGSVSSANSINESGQVVGFSEVSGGDYRAFRWTPNTGMVDLGDINNESILNATGLNDAGEVTGLGSYSSGTRGFFWSPQSGMQDIGGFGSSTSCHPQDINNQGMITGECDGRAFIWTQAGGMVNIGDMGGGSAFGQAINDLNQVTGFGTNSQGQSTAFFYSPSTGMTDLGTLPGGTLSTARGLNNSGTVVGYSTSGSGIRAFVWKPQSGMTDLGLVPGTTQSSWALGVSDTGIVVGTGGEGNRRAFFCTPETGMLNLNDLLDSSGNGWQLTHAQDVNSRGQIIGRGVSPDGTQSAFLLNPQTVFPVELRVARGVHESGTAGELILSDNVDVSVSRDEQGLLARVVMMVDALSPQSDPEELSFEIESSVFARSNVTQKVELFNFDTDQYEMIDFRNASRVGDAVVNVSLTGNVSRFVQPGTNAMTSRVTFNAEVSRARFSANVDRINWHF